MELSGPNMIQNDNVSVAKAHKDMVYQGWCGSERSSGTPLRRAAVELQSSRTAKGGNM